MKIVGETDQGLVRSSNQDAYAVTQFPDDIALAIVCDGMGGASGGNIASDTAVRVIVERVSSAARQKIRPQSAFHLLESAIYAANLTVFDMAAANESLSGMGTTVVAAIIYENTVYIAHAGDSRAYLLKDKTDLIQITTDHSIVQKMIESGQISNEEARFHPKRNVITRALGVGETIEIDYNEVALGENDRLLLCTDGLTNYASAEDIISILSKDEFEDIPEELIIKAKDGGGGDNITAVLISV